MNKSNEKTKNCCINENSFYLVNLHKQQKIAITFYLWLTSCRPGRDIQNAKCGPQAIVCPGLYYVVFRAECTKTYEKLPRIGLVVTSIE